MNKNFLNIIVFILCFNGLGISQEKSKRDHIGQDGKGDIIQLKKEFAQAQRDKDDAQELDLIDKIYLHYSTTSEWDSLKKYSLILAKIQKKNDNIDYYLEGLIKVVEVDFIIDFKRNKHDSLLTYLYSYVSSDKINNKRKAEICNLIADNLSKSGAYDSVLIISKKAMQLSESYDPESAEHFAYSRRYAMFLHSAQKYDEALEVLQKLEKKIDYTIIPDFSKLSLFNIIAQIFASLGDYDKSIDYYNKAMRLAEKNEYTSTKFDILSNLALVNFKKGNSEETGKILKKTIPYYKSKKKLKKLTADYLTQSEIYFALKQYEKSSTFLDSASVWILDQLENSQNLGFEYFNDRIRTDLQLDNLSSAKKGMQQIEYYKLFNSDSKARYLELKYLIAKKEGRSKKALEYFEAYTVKIDSIKSSFITLKSQRIESEFNRKQQEQEIENLNELNISQDKALGIRNTALILGSLMLLILVGLLFGLYRLYLKNQENQKALAQQNKQISEALSQNKVLIKEIHHRVKNNLQVVSSLLNMQARKSQEGETKDALNSSKTRVQSMSILHQNLYQGENLTGVNIEDYLDKVVKNIFDTYNIQDDITLTVDIDPISLDVDTLVPIGLIANELICNALKHAFVNREKGRIWVECKQDNELLILRVADDGCGFEGEELPRKDESLGARLIKSFTKKLDGKISIANNKGTDISITFTKSSLGL